MTDPFLGTGDIYSYDPFKRDTLLQNQDPFQGAYSQTHRMRAFCQVIVNGVDVTDKIKPHLISVRISDGNPEKNCEIEIDDRDGLMPIPPLVASVQVNLGCAREQMRKTFNGKIMEFEHGFGRKQGGRRMWVHASGTNTLTTKLKQPMQDNIGEGAKAGEKDGPPIPMGTWIKHVVKTGGGAGAYVNPEFDKITKDVWDMTGSSPMQEIQGLGEKYGANIQWGEGDFLYFEVKGERGLSCRAVWRDNLVGWRVKPFAHRSTWAGASAQSYNATKGQYEQQDQSAPTGGPVQGGSMGGAPAAVATAIQAAAVNTGATAAMDASHGGIGRIAINGEPSARFNSYVSLEGARAGVDGMYYIWVAEHIYSRQGYVTWLDVVPWTNAPAEESVYRTWPLPRPGPNILGNL